LIAKNGTAIVDSVLAKPNQVDLQGPVPDETVGIGPMAQQLPITPRREFVPVFSRVAGAVFLVGGIVGANQYTGEIWVVAENTAPFALNVPGYQPKRVLAATVGSLDQMLWILDTHFEPQTGDMARLVRINLMSKTHEVIWQGRRMAYFDKHWLMADHDGNVLFVASAKAGSRHVAVRFEPHPNATDTITWTAIKFGVGSLVTAPLVDDEGLFLLTLSSNNKVIPARWPALDPVTPGSVNLGGCM
jgi:hypothetical protein